MKQPNRFRSVFIYLLILAAMLWGFAMLTGGNRAAVPYSTVVDYFQEERVVSFTVSGSGILSMELDNGTSSRHTLADVEAFRREFGWAPGSSPPREAAGRGAV